MNKYYFGGLLLFVPFSSVAMFNLIEEYDLKTQIDTDHVTITYAGWTYHLSSRNRNQDNYIWGIKYKGYEVSTMINSFDNRSYVLSYHKQWHYNDWIDVGYRLGGITGYTKEENSVQLFGITPLISPTINFHYKSFGIETAIQTDVFIFSLNYTF
ncbi:hypothetical protein [Pseudoalteromonas sp. C2R02]|uniref:hypothetical protein n=1 Tax=Pseudoalteromonas sp. C2R02 TaxID=2841565 RepID=UPI00209166C1|nr:hypothetical protein [Pseudoalteromonas sp. C2R02]